MVTNCHNFAMVTKNEVSLRLKGSVTGNQMIFKVAGKFRDIF